MKTFISDVVNLNDRPIINVKVFSKYSTDNYDKLDKLAEEKGYLLVEPAVDEDVPFKDGTGMGNTHLHSGWIATVDDGVKVQALRQIEQLNEKIKRCKQQKGEDIIVGFCQTGKFSIGYSIYVKTELNPQQHKFHKNVEAIKDLESKLQVKVLQD